MPHVPAGRCRLHAHQPLRDDITTVVIVGRRGKKASCSRCCNAAQANPAVLWNHDNDYLHYSDDWYILASKPDEYLLIYYKGNNDAWKGYGGATVYTRRASVQTVCPGPRMHAAGAAPIRASII